MTIQQVCKQSGLTIDTIRYYERIGLITVAKDAYFKHYTQQTVETLVAIKKLRATGLSISKIKWLLSIDTEPKDLSHQQLDAIYFVINDAMTNAKIRIKEINDSLQILESMKNKLIKVKHENS